MGGFVLLAATFIGVVPLSARAQSQTVPFRVALSGTAAPAGGNFTSFYSPVLNASGQVAFSANTSVAGRGIFAGISGSSLTTAALNGTAAPAGGNYTDFIDNNLALNASGQVAFRARTSVSGNGIFVGIPGTPLTTAALTGTTAPSGGNYQDVGNQVLNDSGQVAFVANTGLNVSNIFAGTPGTPMIPVALTGAASPDGGNYLGVYLPLLNASGQVAFQATTSVSARAVFAGIPGTPMTTVALLGGAAPPGGNYVAIWDDVLSLNGSGLVALKAGTTPFNSGIFAGTPGSTLTTAAFTGTPAPAGGNYDGFYPSVLNASGQVAFPAITTDSGAGIFVGTPGTPMATIALQGNAAPNCGGAIFNGNFDAGDNVNVMLNASGQVAFLGKLTTGSGTPAVTSATDQGLFAGAPGSVVLVVRKGDVIDVDPTASVDNRTISAFSFTTGTGGEDGRGMSFNDSGLLVYQLSFTDGSSGIFTSQLPVVPEPTLLFGVAAVGLVAMRRDGRKGKQER